MSKKRPAGPTSLQFFSRLRWLDHRPLADTIEPYRRDVFAKALDERRRDGTPVYNQVVCGRAKKNWKSTDLVLAALYCLIIRRSALGSDGIIAASDEGQASDDLKLAKKLIAANPMLSAEIEPLAKELRLRDGSGSLQIIPKDVAGSHGKTYGFLGIDELHTARDWSLLEALAMDPHRIDALQWITSYASLFNTPGAPLHDLMAIGKAGSDPRMLFSWYAADYTTDPDFAGDDVTPERRANPSIASWPDGMAYIEQQRVRLPSGRFRRLHLNMPGSPEGAAFDQAKILGCVVPGRRSLPYQEGRHYVAWVDMSGGSIDDAVLCIAHLEDDRVVIDFIGKQLERRPFDPREAVYHFCKILRQWNVARVSGDHYAGETFKRAFATGHISFDGRTISASDLYEHLEPRLNAGSIEMLDDPTTIEQLVGLVWRGGKITHEHSAHDDYANAVAGVSFLLTAASSHPVVTPEIVRAYAGAMQAQRAVASFGRGYGLGERAMAQMVMMRNRRFR